MWTYWNLISFLKLLISLYFMSFITICLHDTILENHHLLWIYPRTQCSWITWVQSIFPWENQTSFTWCEYACYDMCMCVGGCVCTCTRALANEEPVQRIVCVLSQGYIHYDLWAEFRFWFLFNKANRQTSLKYVMESVKKKRVTLKSFKVIKSLYFGKPVYPYFGI